MGFHVGSPATIDLALQDLASYKNASAGMACPTEPAITACFLAMPMAGTAPKSKANNSRYTPAGFQLPTLMKEHRLAGSPSEGCSETRLIQ